MPTPFAALALAVLCQDPASAPADPVVARVGTFEIRQSDLLAEMNRLIPLTFYHGRVPRKKMDAFRDRALERLIEKALIYLDAKAKGLAASEEEIRRTFEESLQKAGPAYRSLSAGEKAKLLEKYRPLVERRVLRDKNEALFEKLVPPLKEEAVRAEYESRKSSLLAPKEAHFRHILVKVRPEAGRSEIEAKRALIEKARAEILAGRPFGEVAKKVSEDIYAARGGDMGWVREGSFRGGAVNEAAFSLKPGELSKIVTSIYGFHLVQCVAVKPRRVLSYEEAAPQLRRELAQKIRADARARWLADLRRRFPVERFAVGAFAPRPASRPATRPTGRR